MSRCYSYPPPGYQKKAQHPDLSMPTKVLPKEKKKMKGKEKEKAVKDLEEKGKRSKDVTHKEKKVKVGEKEKDKDREKSKGRKDKDKKEKRKKDGETNGSAHDKDPRSSKLQRASHSNNVLHFNEENGRELEVMTSTPLEFPLNGGSIDATKPCGNNVGPTSDPPSMYSNKQQPANGKVDTAQVPLGFSQPLGGNPHDAESSPVSRPSNRNNHSSGNTVGSQKPQRLLDFSICDTLLQHASWSTLDDADWLCPSSDTVHPKVKAKVEEDTAQQVWGEAVYLTSVDMYSLPYVLPY